jgi:exonuclease III
VQAVVSLSYSLYVFQTKFGLNFYEELERVFNNFLKQHMKIILGDFSVKAGKEDMFKTTTENETLPEINDNGVRMHKLCNI